MSKITLRKSKRTHLHLPDGAPRALVHGADEAANRVREAAEEAGGRVAEAASRASDEVGEFAGRAGGRASDLVHRGRDTAERARRELTRTQAEQARRQVKSQADQVKRDAKSQAKQARRQGRRLLRRSQRAAVQTASTVVDTRLVKQIADLRSEVSYQSAELERALGTLDEVVEATRKNGSRHRGRLIIALGVGAAVMYHFDPEHGPRRRAETVRLVNVTTGRFTGETADDHGFASDGELSDDRSSANDVTTEGHDAG